MPDLTVSSLVDIFMQSTTAAGARSVISAAAAFPLITATQTVYVNKGGSNVTGTGTLDQPFLTIEAAISSVSDASSSKPYQIVVGPGNYGENVATKPFCFVNGSGVDVTVINGVIALSGAWNTTELFGGYSNLKARDGFWGQLGPNQLVPIGCAESVVVLHGIAGNIGIKFRDENSSLLLDESRKLDSGGLGSLSFTNGNLQCYNCSFEELAVTANGFNTIARIYGGSVLSVVFASVDASCDVRVYSCPITGTADLTNGLNLTVVMDAVSYPQGAITLDGGATINRATDAPAIKYTPDDSDNWPDIVPALVSEAMDNLAANKGYLTIPPNSQSGNYTTVASDSGKSIFHPAADTTARTYTIDSNANVPYDLGTAITFINEHGAGILTIAINTDTMRLAGVGTTGSRTLAADGIATAVKITTTSWLISGTGLT